MFTNRRTVVPALVVGAMGLVTAVTGCTATVSGHRHRRRAAIGPSDAPGEGSQSLRDFCKKQVPLYSRAAPADGSALSCSIRETWKGGDDHVFERNDAVAGPQRRS